ncbi:MAG: alkane 1-monooxygenase [Deltaproteobacteria bacterium]|nr:alkane 1-monooxygenase [Deltaproteobacteria bacterium]
MRQLLRALPFSVGLIVPLGAIWVALHPAGFTLVALPLFLFGLIPLLDLVMGIDKAELEPDASKARDWRYDLWLWAWIPLQLAALGVALHVVAGGRHGESSGALSWSAFLLLALSIGLVTGAGINVAHELMHRRGKIERALAELMMTTTTYTHFCVEHVHGHHKHVSTPNDPASSLKGESLYAYLPRTLVGGLRSAWRIESRRRAGLPLSLRDRRVRYPLILAIVYAVVVVVAGPWGAVFFALQSVVAMTLLEIINYIEHYGLARRELSPGVYERCLPAHSWNASERLTNWFLFHLQRHADHHHLASRPYFALRHIEDSPQMPTGYAGMVLLALVPPLWRRVMDPRVEAFGARWLQVEPCEEKSIGVR